MEIRAIMPVDGAAKSAAISKYSPDQQGGEGGRRQQSSDSHKPKLEKKDPNSLDRFFASTAQKPNNERSEFEQMLRKMWEDNNRMQESAKALEPTTTEAMTAIALENAWAWGIYGGYRPIIKK